MAVIICERAIETEAVKYLQIPRELEGYSKWTKRINDVSVVKSRSNSRGKHYDTAGRALQQYGAGTTQVASRNRCPNAKRACLSEAAFICLPLPIPLYVRGGGNV